MNINENTKEKICAFYASDYHFEMISLPYIENKLEMNKKIFILTENNLVETINVLISKVNLEQQKKKEILDLNWENNVKGNKNYIKNINENIENLILERKNLTIIDCYNMEEISEDIKETTRKYNKVLTVGGEKEV